MVKACLKLQEALTQIESLLLIKVKDCPVYRVSKKKYHALLLKTENLVVAPDIETFRSLLQIPDNKTILISSYVLNLEVLEKILREAPASHRIFFETYSDSSRKPFKMT